MNRIFMTLAFSALLLACGEKKEVTQTTTTVASQPALPEGHPPVTGTAATSPMGSTLPNAQGKLSGTVTETMNAGGYTYLKVKTAAGEEWAAIPESTVKKGQEVSIVTQMTAENFESNTLKRKFDRIVFGSLDTGAPVPAGNPMAGAADHMKGGAAAIGDVKVPKAEGKNARTVAEIWDMKPVLNGQPVVVRGKVVKFLGGIMGKNWMHVRDGSGSAEKGDNDLTVTTNEQAKVGDVVVINGKVAVDKDFGAGYKYPVIVEEAKIAK